MTGSRPVRCLYKGLGLSTPLSRNPFHDDIIASGSDDGKVFIWKVPGDFTLYVDDESVASKDVAPQLRLTGHQKYLLVPLCFIQSPGFCLSSFSELTVYRR